MKPAPKQMVAKLKLIVLLQVCAISLALTCQIELASNKGNTLPGLPTLLSGLAVGLGLGWAVGRVSTKFLTRLPLRLVLPIWVGMISLALLFSGLFFNLKIALPLDWRPIIAVGLMATLPGLLTGGLISWRISRELIAGEATSLDHDTLNKLRENLEKITGQFPGAEGDLFVTADQHYMAKVLVPRSQETLVFYFECDDKYPSNPPLAIAVEAKLADGATQPLAYDAPIIYYWHSKYGLSQIIQEALQVLVR